MRSSDTVPINFIDRIFKMNLHILLVNEYQTCSYRLSTYQHTSFMCALYIGKTAATLVVAPIFADITLEGGQACAINYCTQTAVRGEDKKMDVLF